MKTKMIEYLRQHLSGRKEIEIHSLLSGLEKLSKEEIQGVVRLVLDTEIYVNNLRIQNEIATAYTKHN